MSEIPEPSPIVKGIVPSDEVAHATEAAKALVDGDISSSVPAEDAHEDIELSQERLDEILDDSFYSVSCHISSSSKVKNNAEPPLDSWVVRPIQDQQKAPFADKGILELFTVEHINHRFGRVKDDSPNSDDPIVAIAYRTLSRGAGNSGNEETRKKAYDGYTYPTSQGSPGNEFGYNLFLPKSKAEEILAVVQASPEFARTLGDTMMLREYPAEEWGSVRPPYDKWRQAEGGVSRMAFADFLNANDGSLVMPDESRVVEF